MCSDNLRSLSTSHGRQVDQSGFCIWEASSPGRLSSAAFNGGLRRRRVSPWHPHLLYQQTLPLSRVGGGQSAGSAPTTASRPWRASGQHHPFILLSFYPAKSLQGRNSGNERPSTRWHRHGYRDIGYCAPPPPMDRHGTGASWLQLVAVVCGAVWYATGYLHIT